MVAHSSFSYQNHTYNFQITLCVGFEMDLESDDENDIYTYNVLVEYIPT